MPGRCRRSPTRAARSPSGCAATTPCSQEDRKSTRLNSSHGYISYAVFCLKKKKNTEQVQCITLITPPAAHTSVTLTPLYDRDARHTARRLNTTTSSVTPLQLVTKIVLPTS